MRIKKTFTVMSDVLNVLLALAQLLFLYVVALILGNVVSRLPRLVGYAAKLHSPSVDTSSWPPLPDFLGMLFAGILLANVPGNLLGAIPSDWSSYIRKAALTIILARAGLSLDIEALRVLGAATLRLASIPCVVEATVAAVATKLLREDFSWGFCFCLGFVLAAVSPAVVVPSLLALKDEGYGGHITTMVLAAASLDDVVAICGLGIALDIAFAQIEGGGESSVIWTALLAPIAILGGLFVGFIFGSFQYLLTKYALTALILPEMIGSDVARSVIFVACSLVIVFVTSAYDFDAGGYLSVMVSGFVLARGWDKLDQSDTIDKTGFGGTKSVSAHLKTVWTRLMPALFMLIGAQVDLTDISSSQLGIALAVLCIGLFFRILVTFTVTSIGTDMTVKERMFLSIAWFPKATVQAALGSVVLDRALRLSSDIDDDVAADAEAAGKFILTAAVLAIVLTAPTGAVGIFVTGPLWLSREISEAKHPEEIPSETDVGEETTEVCPEIKEHVFIPDSTTAPAELELEMHESSQQPSSSL